ncbi:hypothetical protein CR513_21953, partial [Mucuna pruriens]
MRMVVSTTKVWMDGVTDEGFNWFAFEWIGAPNGKTLGLTNYFSKSSSNYFLSSANSRRDIL